MYQKTLLSVIPISILLGLGCTDLSPNKYKALDGKTITLKNVLKERETLYLCGIKVLPLDNPLGKQAQIKLEEMINQDKEKGFAWNMIRSNEGEVWVYEGKPLSVELVKLGLASHQFDKKCPSNKVLAKAEAEAKRQKLGMWRLLK